MAHESRPRRLIPAPSIWHFQRTLGKYRKGAFQLGFAQEVARRPDPLDNMFNESINHFALYDNHGETFHERPPEQNPAEMANYADGDRPALRFVSLAAAGNITIKKINRSDDLAFKYVDYEIQPCRTTRGRYETDTYGPNQVRIDLLLANCADKLPIIGEVKAKNDANPFFALVQGLWYIVAMGTDHQCDRLNSAYPDTFAWPENGPKSDLYLFLLDYDQNADGGFLDATSNIACQLLEPDRSVARVVRRIVCFNVTMKPDSPALLDVLFSSGS